MGIIIGSLVVCIMVVGVIYNCAKRKNGNEKDLELDSSFDYEDEEEEDEDDEEEFEYGDNINEANMYNMVRSTEDVEEPPS